MKILKISDRVAGPTLKEQGINHVVVIYRAVNISVNSFMPMDYITLSKKFALEHAEHMMWTEEDDYHVISAIVDPESVADAYNPGEYFYVGEEKVGKSIQAFRFDVFST